MPRALSDESGVQLAVALSVLSGSMEADIIECFAVRRTVGGFYAAEAGNDRGFVSAHGPTPQRALYELGHLVASDALSYF